MSNKIKVRISDYGAGAYLMMHGYKVIGGDGKEILFEINDVEKDQFEETKLDYLRSEFHRFDSFLMSIKKIMANNKYIHGKQNTT